MGKIYNEFVVESHGTWIEFYVLRVPLKICLKMGFALKKIWSAGFGPSKFKSAGFCHIKMHFGMQALAPFFGSLQALDFKTQRNKVVCRLRQPPLVYPHSFLLTLQLYMKYIPDAKSTSLFYYISHLSEIWAYISIFFS